MNYQQATLTFSTSNTRAEVHFFNLNTCNAHVVVTKDNLPISDYELLSMNYLNYKNITTHHHLHIICA